MNKSTQITTLMPILLVVIVSAMIFPAVAKSLKSENIYYKSALSSLVSSRSTASLRLFESALTPYLQQRAGITPAQSGLYTPTDADFMTLARSWNSLSPQFRSLYLKATSLPAGRKVYTSPGGHFDILYTTLGTDMVDPTDTYGYGPEATSWQIRTPLANGTPDYVDEVAWSMDSAWNMEIDRLGFVPPTAYTQTGYMSSRYKISLVELGGGVNALYGLTVFTGPDPARNPGFLSYIEIRNSWNGLEWPLVYNQNPQLPLRVTAAHEFFHAIQYAMTWNVQNDVLLDDFPLGWLEGSATLMEELGFDSINDYIQYATDYFRHPQQSLFSTTGAGINIYSHSLLMLYLYHHAPSAPGIDFIHTMQFNDYRARTAFQKNLEQSAAALQQTWPRLLGAYHVQSYFTGNRARAGVFVPDADTMPLWQPDTSDTYSNGTLSKQVESCGFGTFFFKRTASQGDTLTIQFLGRYDLSTVHTDPGWAVNLLLRRNGSAVFDSIQPLELRRTALDTFTIADWREFDALILMATNANHNTLGYAKTAFETQFIETPQFPAGSIPELFPNPVHANKTITIDGSLLTKVSVFTQSGTLVSRADFTPVGTGAPGWTYTEGTGATWNLTNAGGRHVIPGTYILNVYHQDSFGVSAMRRFKLCALP